MCETVDIAVRDMIKSEEMREYFRELLKEQTTEIVSSINFAEKKKEQQEIFDLREKISQEKETREELERKVSELKKENSNLQKILEVKDSKMIEYLEYQGELKKENAKLVIQNKQLAASLMDEQEKSEKNQSALEEEKRKISDELKDYEDKFSLVYNLYNVYCLLPTNIKQRICNIFADENIYSMIVAVSNWNSIEGLWGFTKRRIIEDENEGLSELVDLFMESFRLYSVIDGSKRYELIIPGIGDRFDSDKHSIKGVKTDGIVEKVLLTGIYDSLLKKTVFKAVVQIQ